MDEGEIAHDEQFLLWPQCFQVYLKIKVSFKEIFHKSLKSSAADLLFVGKG